MERETVGQLLSVVAQTVQLLAILAVAARPVWGPRGALVLLTVAAVGIAGILRADRGRRLAQAAAEEEQAASVERMRLELQALEQARKLAPAATRPPVWEAPAGWTPAEAPPRLELVAALAELVECRARLAATAAELAATTGELVASVAREEKMEEALAATVAELARAREVRAGQ